MMIFKFEPIYKERIWGGTMIRDLLRRDTPKDSRIGESWEIVDRKDANSVISNTRLKGQTLSMLLEQQGKSVMGPNWKQGHPFPLLVKWLDCSQRLSLQVHPPEKVAKKLSGEPKTENWYVAEAAPNAGLFIGLKKETSAKDFIQAAEDKTVETLCHRVQSRKGDSVLVESGRLHAIDAGNLILEIQQNSDTTYRVYDWERLGLNGRPRTLHIEESMQCIDFKDYEPKPMTTTIKKGMEIIADSQHFRIKKFNLTKNNPVSLKDCNSDPIMIHILEGKLLVDELKMEKGEHALCPFSSNCLIFPSEDSSILVTDRFC
jgi:mannose-6-phosphate isomerase